MLCATSERMPIGREKGLVLPLLPGPPVPRGVSPGSCAGEFCLCERSEHALDAPPGLTQTVLRQCAFAPLSVSFSTLAMAYRRRNGGRRRRSHHRYAGRGRVYRRRFGYSRYRRRR